MKQLLLLATLLLLIGCGEAEPCCAPGCKPCPCKPAVDPPKPKCPNCPKCGAELVEAKIVIGGPTAPDATTEVTCDLPTTERTRNVGGRDGAGLCVFSSIGHAARWQNESRLVSFQ